jgi:uncharacterized protein YjbJ (UPF0337 family)
MGYGGEIDQEIGEPWLGAKFYDPDTPLPREVTNNAADRPRSVFRHVSGSPATDADDDGILSATDFNDMNEAMIPVHDRMHNFVAMGRVHRSFEDPFVFLLHSNVDRLYARWQTDPQHPERLEPSTVYGTVSGSMDLEVEPWSTGRSRLGVLTRPWCAPENEGVRHTYKHISLVTPPRYDTNYQIQPTPGRLIHTIRYTDGKWQDFFGDVQEAVGERVGEIADIGCSTDNGNNLHLCITTQDGRLFHTMRHGDGKWQSFFGDVQEAVGQNITVTGASCSADQNGNLHLYVSNRNERKLFHTMRHGDGKWQDFFGDVQEAVGQNIRSSMVACAGERNGNLHLCGSIEP